MKLLILLAIVVAVVARSQPAINYQIIKEINSANDATWRAGINTHFLGWTLDEARHLCGTHMGGEILPQKEYTRAELAVPDEWDARTAHPNCPSCREIRDQSACGSCWAFGAVEAMTDRICIASQGQHQFHLSATDMLSCCSSCGMGCQGGYPSSAWSYWQRTGVVTGGNWHEGLCYPYPLEPCDHHVNGTHKPCPPTGPTPPCVKKCENGADWNADKHFGASVYSVTGEEKMKAELVNNGPFEVAFTVYEDFLSYKSGVYKHKTGGYLGGHAVKVLGYGVENGAKYWTIANSWNTDWGNEGLFKIARGNNECGIEGQGVAGVPKP